MSKLPSFENTLIGSSEDLEQRVKAAKMEKEWVNAGKKEIWRIEKFNIKKWPKEEYGKFFGGDCYICLKTNKKGNKITWDVHFWIGSE